MSNLALMRLREQEIGALVRMLSEKSAGFTRPMLVVIGGYALRAFVPFSRYSRDCDFVLQKRLDALNEWKPKDMHLETSDANSGYVRWSKQLRSGKDVAKVGLDFMESRVVTRDGTAFAIDGAFARGAQRATLQIDEERCEVFVPSYADFFTMKVMSSRPSDVRDLAAMVWKNGVPKPRLSALSDESSFARNIRDKIIPAIEHRHFVDSWRGMFVTQEFNREACDDVLAAFRTLT